MLVLIQSNQLEVVCLFSFKSFEIDLYGIYYTEWVFMRQWTAKYGAVNSGNIIYCLSEKLCFNLNQFQNVMFFINKRNRRIMYEEEVKLTANKSRVFEGQRFGKAAPGPPAPFLRHSHTHCLDDTQGGLVCNGRLRAPWRHTKAISPRCSAHSRCLKNTECCWRYERKHFESFCAVEVPCLNREAILHLLNDGWGGESTDATGCGHVTLMMVFLSSGSCHACSPPPHPLR